MNTHISNTYDLIVESESEDKGRNLIETLIYAIFILSAVVSIVHAAAAAGRYSEPHRESGRLQRIATLLS